MTAFVTGGKTWKLPVGTNATALPPAANTLKAKVSEFGKVMLVLYGMFLGAFMVASIGLLLVSLFKNDGLSISATGGIIIPESRPFTIPIKSITLILLVPTIVFFIMELLEKKTLLFIGKHSERNGGICFAIIGLLLVVSSVIIYNDLGISAGSKAASERTDVMDWMQTRYGFDPYYMPKLDEVISGKKLYSDDASFPAHDVYLKQVDGAYLLLDAKGNELPTKN